MFLLLVEVEGLLGFCTLDAGSMSRLTVRTAKRALIGRVIVKCGQQEPGRRSGDDDLRASTGEANISTVALPFPASVVMSLGNLPRFGALPYVLEYLAVCFFVFRRLVIVFDSG